MRTTERSLLTLLPILALMLLPVAAQAQDTTTAKPDRWRRIGISEDGDTTYIDTRSIVRDHIREEVNVWVEIHYKTPQTDNLGKNYTKRLSRAAFDCAARASRLVSWSTFTKNGSVAGGDDDIIERSFPIPPNTMGESILETVCAPSNERPGGQAMGNNPPTPTTLFTPPLPIPDRARGFHLVAEYDIDETGKIVDFKFTPTPDGGYNRRLEAILKSFTFRPGTTSDGTPIRMKTQVVYDF